MRIESSRSLSSSQNELLRKRYSGIQPQYFPRLHYFARILNADIFVIRDEAQYVRKHKYPDGKVDKSYQAHTPIKQSFGRQLLTVTTKNGGLNPINKTQDSYDHDWVAEHLENLQVSYNKSQYFSQAYKEIENILNVKYSDLASLNNATIFWGILRLLGEEDIITNMLSIDFVNKKLQTQEIFRLKKIIKASETIAVKAFDAISANEKIVALCAEVGTNEDYCGGTGASAYMDEDIFARNNIKITVQDWKCKEYPQLFDKLGFIPNLSIIDLLTNVSAKDAAKLVS